MKLLLISFGLAMSYIYTNDLLWHSQESKFSSSAQATILCDEF